MPIRILILFLVLLTAGACARVKNIAALEEFETSSQKYNRMLRWDELEMAGVRFGSESLKEEFAGRAKAAKGVTIADYRIIFRECRPEKNVATVVIDIDYFIPPSITVKTVQDVQRWEYVEESGKKSWKLMSLLPEFK